MEYNGGGVISRSIHQQHKGLGSLSKPTPSKWDDAQKWLAGFSRVGAESRNGKISKPRNSNAEDRRLIAPPTQMGRDSCEGLEAISSDFGSQEEGEMKKMDCTESFRPVEVLRSVCVRDMGTEVTPASSLEPSRTATPIRVAVAAAAPSFRSTPICSRTTTPRRPVYGGQELVDCHHLDHSSFEERNEFVGFGGKIENCVGEEDRCSSSLERKAIAWDEAERAKYSARYKREEVKIQAWESRQKRIAETEMKRMEAKADRIKARAQEKLVNKLASARRRAEEKRATAQTKLNEQAAKISERADYVRRTGHLPSFLSKLPSLCR